MSLSGVVGGVLVRPNRVRIWGGSAVARPADWRPTWGAGLRRMVARSLVGPAPEEYGRPAEPGGQSERRDKVSLRDPVGGAGKVCGFPLNHTDPQAQPSIPQERGRGTANAKPEERLNRHVGPHKPALGGGWFGQTTDVTEDLGIGTTPS